MRRIFYILTLTAMASFPLCARAGTTGVISGTVSDVNHRPIAAVRVTAASPSATGSATTDASGFYNIANLPPDTYTVSFQKSGFSAVSIPGVVVFQDQTNTTNVTLVTELRTIASVQSRSQQSLVQPGQTADVYNISSQELAAAEGGDNVHKTLYDFTQAIPGVTGMGANAQPRVRGGLATDANFLYDDVPINDRLTGFFSTGNGYFQTTTISAVGVSNVQVYTGGYDSRYGEASQGVFNSIIKRGAYPSYGLISTAIRGPLFGHYLQVEYGTATPDRRFSAYFAYDRADAANEFGDGVFSFPLATFNNPGNGPGPQLTLDAVANFHYRPNDRNDLQFLIQNGNGRFDGNYLLAGGHPVGVVPCTGVAGFWVPFPPVGSNPPAGQTPGYNITNPGISSTGQPCTVTIHGKSYNTGMQYVALDPNRALETYHYSGVGKLQLNHSFGDKLFGYVRLAENFNQYILNQPLDNPNYNNAIQPGQPAPVGNFAVDPFPGTTRDFYGDRRQQAYIGQSEIDWNPNANSQYFAGAIYERDNLLQAYYDRAGTGGYSSPPSAFDANGVWPNEYTLANFPTFQNSAYVGTVQKLHKFVLAPSLRYDILVYDIPQSAGGSYSKPVFSPRLSIGYQFGINDYLLASYGVTSSFIPATYVYNGSVDGIQAAGQYRDPYLPGATEDPPIDHNLGLTYEHGFRDGHTSLRIAPWYHQTNNRLEVLRNPLVVNGVIQTSPTTGAVIFQPGAVGKSGGIAKDFGVEFGLNHIINGDGLSWFLAATYQSYFSTSFTLAAAAINPQNPNAYFLNNGNGVVYRVPDQPPVSVSWTGNYNYRRYHFLPYLLWQCCAYYNVQGTGSSTTPDKVLHTGPGYFYANATLSWDIAQNNPHSLRLGVRVTNVFDNQKNSDYPVINSCYGVAPAKLSLACQPAGAAYDGGNFSFPPGRVPNTLYFFPPVSRNPQTFEVFLTQQF